MNYHSYLNFTIERQAGIWQDKPVRILRLMRHKGIL